MIKSPGPQLKELFQRQIEILQILCSNELFKRRCEFTVKQYLQNRRSASVKFKDIANIVEELIKNCGIAKTVGGSTGIASGLLIIGGLLLAPVSGGVSLVMTATGTGMAIGSTATSLISQGIRNSNLSGYFEEAKNHFQSLNDKDEKFNTIIQQLCQNLDSMDKYIKLHHACKQSLFQIPFEQSENYSYQEFEILTYQNYFYLLAKNLPEIGFQNGQINYSNFEKTLNFPKKSNLNLITMVKGSECFRKFSTLLSFNRLIFMTNTSKNFGMAAKTTLSTTSNIFGHAFALIGIGFGIWNVVQGAKEINGSQIADQFRNSSYNFDQVTSQLQSFINQIRKNYQIAQHLCNERKKQLQQRKKLKQQQKRLEYLFIQKIKEQRANQEKKQRQMRNLKRSIIIFSVVLLISLCLKVNFDFQLPIHLESKVIPQISNNFNNLEIYDRLSYDRLRRMIVIQSITPPVINNQDSQVDRILKQQRENMKKLKILMLKMFKMMHPQLSKDLEQLQQLLKQENQKEKRENSQTNLIDNQEVLDSIQFQQILNMLQNFLKNQNQPLSDIEEKLKQQVYSLIKKIYQSQSIYKQKSISKPFLNDQWATITGEHDIQMQKVDLKKLKNLLKIMKQKKKSRPQNDKIFDTNSQQFKKLKELLNIKRHTIHHIIPGNKIKKILNSISNIDEMTPEKITDVLNVLNKVINHPRNIQFKKLLISQINLSKGQVDISKILLQYIYWNPRNVVLGPVSQSRSHDPGPQIDWEIVDVQGFFYQQEILAFQQAFNAQNYLKALEVLFTLSQPTNGIWKQGDDGKYYIEQDVCGLQPNIAGCKITKNKKEKP